MEIYFSPILFNAPPTETKRKVTKLFSIIRYLRAFPASDRQSDEAPRLSAPRMECEKCFSDWFLSESSSARLINQLTGRLIDWAPAWWTNQSQVGDDKLENEQKRHCAECGMDGTKKGRKKLIGNWLELEIMMRIFLTGGKRGYLRTSALHECSVHRRMEGRWVKCWEIEEMHHSTSSMSIDVANWAGLQIKAFEVGWWCCCRRRQRPRDRWQK